ncbi:hypothetical protein [Kitasatospora sp. NPDC004289]
MTAFDRDKGGAQVLRSAIYLRAYPFDATAMDCHRRALEELAAELGLPLPLVFLDNGRRAADGLPARESLRRAVAAGLVDLVLVPGPYVFGLDDAQARAAVEDLARQGCRVVQLRSRRGRPRREGASGPLAPAA